MSLSPLDRRSVARVGRWYVIASIDSPWGISSRKRLSVRSLTWFWVQRIRRYNAGLLSTAYGVEVLQYGVRRRRENIVGARIYARDSSMSVDETGALSWSSSHGQSFRERLPPREILDAAERVARRCTRHEDCASHPGLGHACWSARVISGGEHRRDRRRRRR
jgi:hypothetical protein